jgi:hypothetical protein
METRKMIKKFAKGFYDSFYSQIRMFPKMLTPEIEKVIDQHRSKALAWKLGQVGVRHYRGRPDSYCQVGHEGQRQAWRACAMTTWLAASWWP